MIVDVAVPVPLGRSFHYLVNEEMKEELTVGSVLGIPFGSRKIFGFVIGFPDDTKVELDKLKAIESVLVKEPVFDSKMLDFLRWISDYYVHPIGEVIAAAIPKAYWERKKVKKRPLKEKELNWENQAPQAIPTLTEEQKKCLETILSAPSKKTFLLHGVTGSGKTEVYMRLLAESLEKGLGGLVLVPEIALTPQLVSRFSGRFGEKVAVLHSDLTQAERFFQWEKIRKGEATIVVGARSAVFAPLANIGVIIVDEEHEASFKQEDSLRYNARDLAVVRGMMNDAKVVLGSATPSLESFQNALSEKYTYLQLTQRVHAQPMPRATFVDIKDPSNAYSLEHPWLSNVLVSKVHETLSKNQQVLLFLNRLGYAHFLYCGDCGHTWRCLNCDVAMTYYQNPPHLQCHYCALDMAVPISCTECHGSQLKSIGLGTEQVEKELIQIFPKARIARMDRSQIKGRKELEEILKRIGQREVDIIVGTQMVTKGHDFPGISLVGVLLADSSLNIPDFRANERTYQVLTQVSGRAGRADLPGEVVIQTVNPLNPVLQLVAQNKTKEFYQNELEARRLYGFPPFRRLALLRFQHRHLHQVENFSNEVTTYLKLYIEKNGVKCTILGPSEAPLSRIKNLYRWQCLVKGEGARDVQRLLKAAQDYVIKRKQNVQFSVDVDPMNSM